MKAKLAEYMKQYNARPEVKAKWKRRRLDMKKVDQSKIVDIQSLPANPLLEAPFLKQTALQVKVFVGNKVYVANTGDADVSIPVGTFLCGYGRGKFDRNSKGNFNPDCHHMFKIKTCDDLVYTSKMVTVKEVLAEQRANNPEAKIAYHSMFDIASTDKDAFGVKLEHEVFFIPAFTSGEDGGTEPVNHAKHFGWEAPRQYLRELTLRRGDMVCQVVSPGSGPCPSAGPLQEIVRPPCQQGLGLDVRGALAFL